MVCNAVQRRKEFAIVEKMSEERRITLMMEVCTTGTDSLKHISISIHL
jgi:hypothetical protein